MVSLRVREAAALIPDDIIVSRAQAGDDDAFEELIGRHRDRLFYVALAFLGPAWVPEAEDIVQVTVIKAYRSLGSFRQDSSFATWISRIARREALAVKERARYRRAHVGEDALQSVEDPAAGADARLIKIQSDADLQRCIQKLPEVYQTSLNLYYWLDWPVREVAAVLELPENTVKSYLHRARQLLHTCLTASEEPS